VAIETRRYSKLVQSRRNLRWPGEMGRWQQREVDVALDLQANRQSFPVIPVLLPGCEPPLGILRQLTWVDLRNHALDQAIVILAEVARGKPPGPDRLLRSKRPPKSH
jgi:hypothetical protein